MTTEPDSTSSTPPAPSARAWWKPRLPRPAVAFAGPMTGARLAAYVGLALWTLVGLAAAAVVVAGLANWSGTPIRDSWPWEVYKALAQLVVAALGVGFAYAFPLRLAAQRTYSELREQTIAFGTAMAQLARGSVDHAGLDHQGLKGLELSARLKSLGAAQSLLDAIDEAVRAATQRNDDLQEALHEEPNLYQVVERSEHQRSLLARLADNTECAIEAAARLAALAAETPPP